MGMRKLLFIILLGIVALLAVVPSAIAAFPGGNGKVAFDRPVTGPDGGTDFKIFAINPDGTGEHSITPPDASDTNPSWSADGGKLVASSFGILTTMDAGGGDRTTLQFGGQPSWSPDGTRITFTRLAHFQLGSQNTDIFVVNADNTGLVNLIGDPPGDAPPFDDGPAWSPDGTRIAFNSAPSGRFERAIHAISADGGGRVALTSGYRDFSPDWSPDGRMIAFKRYAFEGDDSDVYVMNADGTGVRRLTDNDVNDEEPVWSPDGTKIAFARELFPFQIRVMNADGTNDQLLASNGRNADWQPLPNRPPDCSAVRATPSSLGAPNHRFMTVTISGATDPDGDAVDLAITGVTQDEPVGAPDAISTTQPNRVRLRAERDPRGDGRVDRIAFEADDGRGGACTGFATAGVRRGSQAPVDSAPPSYDSFGS